jgi:UPF0755 protein
MPPPTQEKKIIFFALGVIFLGLAWAASPPWSFPDESIIEVSEGMGLQSLSEELKANNVIHSPFWFRTTSILFGGERSMKAGSYYFESPQSVFTVAFRILRGDYRIETVKITIPEGFTVKKISSLFGEKFVFFDNAAFEGSAPEGYLFPDTYFMTVTATASSTIKIMRDNFIRKIFPLMPDVELSKRSLEDIVTMASLIEAEANNQLDREMVSDVLWKRLKVGMPLQVDVEMKTYEFEGLPERPINSPGLLSIQAALHPTTTPYLYYLTGDDGKMHYARNFDAHKANIEKYLR